MKQEIKDQIRKMAEAEYPFTDHVMTNRRKITQLANRGCFERGAEAVMERLDIDIPKAYTILSMWNFKQISETEAKQAILDAIRIS